MNDLNILDFNWHWLLLMVVSSCLGVVLREGLVWKRDELGYDWATRKGDFIVSILFAPITTILVLPFVFDFMDGSQLFGLKFSLSWYNYGVVFFYGFFFLMLIEKLDKKGKKQIEEL